MRHAKVRAGARQKDKIIWCCSCRIVGHAGSVERIPKGVPLLYGHTLRYRIGRRRLLLGERRQILRELQHCDTWSLFRTLPTENEQYRLASLRKVDRGICYRLSINIQSLRRNQQLERGRVWKAGPCKLEDRFPVGECRWSDRYAVLISEYGHAFDVVCAVLDGRVFRSDLII